MFVRVLVSLALAVVVLYPRTTWAWVETRVTGTLATVDVDPSGSAQVSYELRMQVRGGPLKRVELDGIDLDAVLAPEASVVPADVPGAYPLPLQLNKSDDGQLTLEIEGKRGVRAGTFLFRFRYGTDLLKRGLIRARGSNALVTWVAPRLGDGVDSARVIFRLPPSPEAPTLPAFDVVEQSSESSATDGAFISNYHRTADKDEVEIVRPHVARGEPVLWKILTRSHGFPALRKPFSAAAPSTTDTVLPLSINQEPLFDLRWGLSAVVFALGYAALVGLKGRRLQQLAPQKNAKLKPLVPLALGLRVLLTFGMVSFALAAAYYWDEPTWAAACLVLAGCLAIEQIIPELAAPRGPGQWLSLRPEEAFLARRHVEQTWFDFGSLRGRIVAFSVITVWILLAAFWSIERSLYDAALSFLGLFALAPIWLTGRPSTLWTTPYELQAQALRSAYSRLKKWKNVKVTPYARIAEGQETPDELRLLVLVKQGELGLLSIELGQDIRYSQGGPLPLPYVLVRVREDSPCFERLPRGFLWTRGRQPDERVSIVYPKLLNTRACLALLAALVNSVSKAPASISRRASQAEKRDLRMSA